MSAWQFMKALAVSEQNGWARFVSTQNYVNLLFREEEREMLPLCQSQGIGVIPWSPLARGRLTRDWDEVSAPSEKEAIGKMIYAETAEADRKVVQAVAGVAREQPRRLAQVAMAWLLHKAGITAPIVGAIKPQHLDDAVAALDVALSAEEIKVLEAPYVPHAVAGFS